MKKIAGVAMFVVFSFFCSSVNVFAQKSIDTYLDLDEEQRVKSKELQEEYKEQKADLEIQLKKLQKDKEIAVKDKNTSLVERRTREIKETQAKIKNLGKEYTGKYSEILTDQQKNEANIASDFYAKELAAEQAKMEAAENGLDANASEAKAPAKSSPKKKAAKKTSK